MATTDGLRVRISADVTDYQEAMQKVIEAMHKTQNETDQVMRDLTSQWRNAQDAAERYSHDVDFTARTSRSAYDEATQEMMNATYETSEVISDQVEETSKEVKRAAEDAVDHTRNAATIITRIIAGLGLTKILKESAEQFGNLEKSTFRFISAMKQMEVPQRIVDSLDQYATSLKELYGINEFEVRKAFADITRLVGSAGPVETLKESLVNMAIATGESFESVSTQIARAMTIGLTSLHRWGIVATEEQEARFNAAAGNIEQQADILNEILNEKFGGALEAYGNTAVSANERAKRAFIDLSTQLGATVLPAITGVLTIINKISEAIGGLGVAIGVLATIWLAASAVRKASMILEGKQVDGLVAKYIGLGIAKLWSINPILAATAGAAMAAGIIALIYGITKGLAAIGGISPSNNMSDETNDAIDDTSKKDKEGDTVININIDQDNLGDYNARTSNVNGTRTNVRTR